MVNSLNQQHLSSRRDGCGSAHLESPFPHFTQVERRPDEFITRARLYAVLMLILTDTVEIFTCSI